MSQDVGSTALIVTDVQNDFCEGGSLAVVGGSGVAVAITRYIGENRDAYRHIVATRDHHIDPGAHFSDHPDYVDSWPAHCVVGTAGVELHPGLDRDPIEAVFDKGEYRAAYSGFEGIDPAGSALGDWLRRHGVTAVDIVGIATDHCVTATALDAVAQGFATRVLLDLTAGVAPATTEQALTRLAGAGVELVGTPALGTP